MRNTVVSVVVIGILLMGCKSIPRSESSALMADVKTLEQEAMASISWAMSSEDFRHSAAVILLLLIVAGVWSARRSSQSEQSPS